MELNHTYRLRFASRLFPALWLIACNNSDYRVDRSKRQESVDLSIAPEDKELFIRNGDLSAERPPVVRIKYRDGSTCTGTVFKPSESSNKRCLLTAEHCPSDGSIFVTKSANQEPLDSGWTMDPSKGGADPTWDLKVVRLKQNAANSLEAYVIDAMVKPEPKGGLPNGAKMEMIGYGRSVDHDASDTFDGKKRKGTAVYRTHPYFYGSYEVFAIDGLNQLACKGDSGSPLIYNGLIVGVLSEVSNHALGCGSHGLARYTSVANSADTGNYQNVMNRLNDACETASITINPHPVDPQPTNSNFDVDGKSVSLSLSPSGSPQIKMSFSVSEQKSAKKPTAIQLASLDYNLWIEGRKSASSSWEKVLVGNRTTGGTAIGRQEFATGSGSEISLPTSLSEFKEMVELRIWVRLFSSGTIGSQSKWSNVVTLKLPSSAGTPGTSDGNGPTNTVFSKISVVTRLVGKMRYDDRYNNWGGAHEIWFYANGKYYWMRPNGAIHLYVNTDKKGQFLLGINSPLVFRVDPRYYGRPDYVEVGSDRF